jgi:hypothetical protein
VYGYTWQGGMQYQKRGPACVEVDRASLICGPYHNVLPVVPHERLRIFRHETRTVRPLMMRLVDMVQAPLVWRTYSACSQAARCCRSSSRCPPPPTSSTRRASSPRKLRRSLKGTRTTCRVTHGHTQVTHGHTQVTHRVTHGHTQVTQGHTQGHTQGGTKAVLVQLALPRGRRAGLSRSPH